MRPAARTAVVVVAAAGSVLAAAVPCRPARPSAPTAAAPRRLLLVLHLLVLVVVRAWRARQRLEGPTLLVVPLLLRRRRQPEVGPAGKRGWPGAERRAAARPTTAPLLLLLLLLLLLPLPLQQAPAPQAQRQPQPQARTPCPDGPTPSPPRSTETCWRLPLSPSANRAADRALTAARSLRHTHAQRRRGGPVACGVNARRQN